MTTINYTEHSGKGFWARVILDSIGPQENRLTTMEFTLPKLWLAEFNTHCMFARNGASTRAIPFEKQLQALYGDTFIPQEWPLENPGMAARNNVQDEAKITSLQSCWIAARDQSIQWASHFARNESIHKQLAGRLLEPFRYQTTLVTGDAGSYSNFFHLRRDKAAAPEIRAAADQMWEVYYASKPTPLPAGAWHLPLLRVDDLADIKGRTTEECVESMKRVSAARCARLSYLTHHGKRDVQEDYKLFYKLTSAGHWSPLEHVCQALPVPGVLRVLALRFLNAVETGHGKWPGWHQFRKDFKGEYVTNYVGQ